MFEGNSLRIIIYATAFIIIIAVGLFAWFDGNNKD